VEKPFPTTQKTSTDLYLPLPAAVLPRTSETPTPAAVGEIDHLQDIHSIVNAEPDTFEFFGLANAIIDSSKHGKLDANSLAHPLENLNLPQDRCPLEVCTDSATSIPIPENNIAPLTSPPLLGIQSVAPYLFTRSGVATPAETIRKGLNTWRRTSSPDSDGAPPRSTLSVFHSAEGRKAFYAGHSMTQREVLEVMKNDNSVIAETPAKFNLWKTVLGRTRGKHFRSPQV